MVLIIHNVRSLYNVGSMFRTADGAGVLKIYLTGITGAPLDRFGRKRSRVVKTSLGAEDFVAWEYSSSLSRLIERLRRDGYAIIALEQSDQSVDYRSVRLGKGQRVALIVGNEVRGIVPNVLKRCDQVMHIPMRGKKESLNVSVACGIAVYYFIR